MANLELKVPLRIDNVFAIGSMSKQITAVAILQLVGQGKLNLNDDIKKHLTDYNSHNLIALHSIHSRNLLALRLRALSLS